MESDWLVSIKVTFIQFIQPKSISFVYVYLSPLYSYNYFLPQSLKYLTLLNLKSLCHNLLHQSCPNYGRFKWVCSLSLQVYSSLTTFQINCQIFSDIRVINTLTNSVQYSFLSCNRFNHIYITGINNSSIFCVTIVSYASPT